MRKERKLPEPAFYLGTEPTTPLNTNPAKPLHHESAVTALWLGPDALVSGDEKGIVATWTAPETADALWSMSASRELGGEVSALVRHAAHNWAAVGQLLYIFQGDETPLVHDLGAPILDLQLRNQAVFAWVPPHIIRVGIDGIESQWDTNVKDGTIDISSDGLRWVAESSWSSWNGQTRQIGKASEQEEELTIKKEGHCRWVGKHLLETRADKYSMKLLKPNKRTGKEAFGCFPQPVAHPRTVVDGDRAAWIDQWERVTVSAIGKGRWSVLGFQRPRPNESLGRQPRDVETVEYIRGKHKLIGHNRVLQTQSLALSGDQIAVGDCAGEVVVFDLETRALHRLGAPPSVLQPAVGRWIYRDKTHAAAWGNGLVYALTSEGVVCTIDPAKGTPQNTPIHIPLDQKIHGMTIVNELLVLQGEETWLGYNIEDGTERWRQPVPLSQMVVWQNTMVGFETHSSYSIGARTGHQPFLLDLATGTLSAMEPPTPPGARDNAGWDSSLTRVASGLICTFDHGEEDGGIRIQSAGKKTITLVDTRRFVTYLWTPHDGVLKPLDISPSPCLNSHDGRYAVSSDSEGEGLVLYDFHDDTTIRQLPQWEGLLAFNVEEDLALTDQSGDMELWTLGGEKLHEWRVGHETSQVFPTETLTHLIRVVHSAGIWWERIR